MTDQEILGYYKHAYNHARQTGGGGRETPHEIAHVAALKAVLAVGGGENGTITTEEMPLSIQPEDPAVGHQRRLNFSSHWLDQGGRRQRIAANPSFTHVTDAFAAGGIYERAYLAGESKAEERVGSILAEQENAVHAALAAANGMQALLDDLHDMLGVETPEALVASIQQLIATRNHSGAAPASSAEDLTEPIVAGAVPAAVELDAGTHAWCSCGRSESQPFCDGAHKVVNAAGGDHAPVPIKLRKRTSMTLCMCKQTSTPPYCDGTHDALEKAPPAADAPAPVADTPAPDPEVPTEAPA